MNHDADGLVNLSHWHGLRQSDWPNVTFDPSHIFSIQCDDLFHPYTTELGTFGFPVD